MPFDRSTQEAAQLVWQRLKEAGVKKELVKAAGAGDMQAVQAIEDAFNKADEQQSPDGPTFGELFKVGVLPSK